MRISNLAAPDRRYDLQGECKAQGHDAWVAGDENVAVVDWFGASSYAR